MAAIKMEIKNQCFSVPTGSWFVSQFVIPFDEESWFV